MSSIKTPRIVRNIFFFGAFNPSHFGHRAAMTTALDRTVCEGHLIIVPASDRPTWGKVVEPFTHRVAMLRLLVESLPEAVQSKIIISSIEQDLLHQGFEGGYTITALAKLQNEFAGKRQDALLLGADAAATFHRWKDWDEIMKRCMILVIPRDRTISTQEMYETLDPVFHPFVASGKIHLLGVKGAPPTADISSTAIRQGAWDQMTEISIAKYSSTHQLYTK